MKISKQQARQFLLKKQLLWPPHSLSGPKAIEQVFTHLRIIQYDPLNPCGRNPDLVLQARIADYHPEGYYPWLYESRRGVEVYDKELCIIPIEDLPLTYFSSNFHSGRREFAQEFKSELEVLLKRIEREGPLSSADIVDNRRVNTYWSESQWGRAALESLWLLGRIVIVHRRAGKKYYHVPHIPYGEQYRYKEAAQQVLSEEAVLRRINAVGILPIKQGSDGWRGLGTAKESGPIVDKLIKSKALVEIEVEGVRGIFIVDSRNQHLLEDALPMESRMVFIAPLDTLIWDRGMIEALFDFRYRWEVYTPAAKREYGYYVLPILYGEKFVGRIEPVLSKDKKLEIKGMWKERNWDEATHSAFDEALHQFENYLRRV